MARKRLRPIMRTRRLMILWSLPVVAIALFAAGKFFSMPLQAQLAIDSYSGGYYGLSADTADNLMFLNIGETWVPYFDRGTAYAAGGAFTMATDDLSKALELAPEDRECMVRMNLARAWEQQADTYRDAGYFQGAILLYETAKAVIDGGEEAGCFEPEDEQEQQEQEQQSNQGGDGEQGEQGGDGQQGRPDGANPDEITPHEDPGENLEDADKRVDQKIENAERQRDGQGDQGGQPGDPDQGGPGSGGDEQQDAVEKLREHGDEAEQDKQDQDAEQRGQDSDREYVEKPW